MADTKLRDVGPDIGQLSTDLSFLERTQISAIQNLSGSMCLRPGEIPGSVTRSLSGIDNTMRSGIDLGSNLAAQLENAGSVRSNARDFITDIISRAVNNRTSLGTTDALGIALSDPSNRSPSRSRNVEETIDAERSATSGSNALQFPADLVGNTPAYLVLNFKQYKRDNPFKGGRVEGSNKILLPLPENLTFSHSIRLQEADTGIYGDVMNAVGSELTQIAGSTNLTTAKDAITNLTNKLTGTTTSDAKQVAAQVAARAGFAALNSVDEVAGGLAGQLLRGIPNPHPTVFFKGVELRQFQWNWKMVPKTKKDAKAIQDIITKLRGYILPSTKNSGNFLNYPYLVLPEIVAESSDSLYGKFKRCMVSQFNVNFSGEGTSAFFVDGRPVSINLSMVFMEVEMFTGGGDSD